MEKTQDQNNTVYPQLQSHFALRQVGSDLLYLMNADSGEYYELDPMQFQALKFADGVQTVESIANTIGLHSDEVVDFFLEQRNEQVVTLSNSPQEKTKPHYRRCESPHLSDVLVEVTGRCNLQCRHCFNVDYSEDAAVAKEMTTDQLLRLIEELDNMNVRRIQLSGGEALMREDLWDIIAALEKHKIFLDVISTNATLINSEQAKLFGKRFREHGALYISVDGITPDSYEALRGPGTFEQLKRSLDLLSEEKCRMFLNTMAFRNNLDELEKMYDWVVERPSIQGWRIGLPKVLGRYTQNHKHFEVEFENVIQLFKKLLKRWLKDRPAVRLELSDFFRTDALETGFDTHYLTDNPCKYAMTNASIKPDGTVVFCASLEIYPSAVLGNAIEKGLPAVWYGARHQDFRTITLGDLEACKACRYAKLCGGGCRSNALLSYDDIMAVDPRACVAMQMLEEEILELLPSESQEGIRQLINSQQKYEKPTGYQRFI